MICACRVKPQQILWDSLKHCELCFIKLKTQLELRSWAFGWFAPLQIFSALTLRYFMVLIQQELVFVMSAIESLQIRIPLSVHLTGISSCKFQLKDEAGFTSEVLLRFTAAPTLLPLNARKEFISLFSLPLKIEPEITVRTFCSLGTSLFVDLR